MDKQGHLIHNEHLLVVTDFIREREGEDSNYLGSFFYEVKASYNLSYKMVWSPLFSFPQSKNHR